MERKEAMLKTGCLRMLIVLAVVLYAVPCIAEYKTVTSADDPYILESEETNFLHVYSGGIVQIKPGGYTYDPDVVFDKCIDVYDGTLEIYGSHTWTESDKPVVATPEATVTLFTDSLDSIILEKDPEWPKPGEATLVDTTIILDNYDNGWQGKLTWSYDGETYSLTILTYVDITVEVVGVPPEPEPIIVQIDIKPGSDPNPINPGSNGVIPVAILTTDTFDASTVDPDTVTLAGAEVAVRGKSEKTMARLEDIDGDGDDDLLLQIDTQSDGAVWETGPVTLEGITYDGQAIEGTDDVVIVPPE